MCKLHNNNEPHTGWLGRKRQASQDQARPDVACPGCEAQFCARMRMAEPRMMGRRHSPLLSTCTSARPHQRDHITPAAGLCPVRGMPDQATRGFKLHTYRHWFQIPFVKGQVFSYHVHRQQRLFAVSRFLGSRLGDGTGAHAGQAG